MLCWHDRYSLLGKGRLTLCVLVLLLLCPHERYSLLGKGRLTMCVLLLLLLCLHERYSLLGGRHDQRYCRLLLPLLRQRYCHLLLRKSCILLLLQLLLCKGGTQRRVSQHGHMLLLRKVDAKWLGREYVAVLLLLQWFQWRVSQHESYCRRLLLLLLVQGRSVGRQLQLLLLLLLQRLQLLLQMHGLKLGRGACTGQGSGCRDQGAGVRGRGVGVRV